METLKEIWESQGLTPTEVAARAGISPSTLYKIARKERVASRNLVRVLQVLGLTKQQYEALRVE